MREKDSFVKTTKKTNKSSVVILVSILVVTLLAATSYGFFASREGLWPFSSSQSTETTQDFIDGQQTKRDALEDNATKDEEKDQSGRTVVDVGVAYSGIVDNSVEVRAFTPSVIEGNGVCIATFTRGDQTVSAQSPAFVDSTTSQCQPIQISLDEFEAEGVWSLSVEYSSPTSRGFSQASEVRIP